MAGTSPTTPTPATIRRLAYAADLSRTGDQLLAQNREGTRAQALVLFDACLESLIRTALDVRPRAPREPPRGTELHLGGLLTALDRASSPKSLFTDGQVVEAELLRLHDIRNGIQHSGVNPSENSVREQVSAFRTNAVRLVRFCFGLDWNKLSVGLLIENQFVQELFQQGEVAQAENRIEDAIVAFVATFEAARFAEQQDLIGSMISWAAAAADTPKVRAEPGHDEIVDYTTKVHEEVEVLKLRLDYKRYRRYADIASDKISPAFAPFWPYGEPTASNLVAYWKDQLTDTLASIRRSAGSDPDTFAGFVAWVEFAKQFVGDAVLYWQSTQREALARLI